MPIERKFPIQLAIDAVDAMIRKTDRRWHTAKAEIEKLVHNGNYIGAQDQRRTSDALCIEIQTLEWSLDALRDNQKRGEQFVELTKQDADNIEIELIK